MAETELKVILGVEDNLSAALKQLNKDIGKTAKETQKSFGNIAKVSKQIGITMTAIGASITAAMVMAANSSERGKAALDDIKGSIGEIAKEVGDAVAPVFEVIGSIVKTAADALKAMPKPLKDILGITTTLAGIMATLGGSIFLLIGQIPNFINGLKSIGLYTKLATIAQWAWNIAMKANPIGIIITAIAALVGGLIALTAWLDKGKDAVSDLNGEIKPLNEAAEKLAEDWKEVQKEWAFSQTKAGKLGISMKDLEEYLLNTGKSTKILAMAFNVFGDDVNAVAESMDIDLRDVANSMSLTTDKMIDDFKSLTDKAKQLARDRTDAEKDAVDERLSLLNKEYQATLKVINARLSKELAGYQSQIDAINAEQEASDKAYEDAQNNARIASLKAQIATEKDSLKRVELQKELSGLLIEIARDKERQEREDNIQAIEDKMQAARDAAQKEEDLEKEKYEKQVTALEDQKELLDKQLEATQQSYDNDLAAFETLLSNKLLALQDYLNAYNKAMGSLAIATGTTYTPATVETGAIKKYHSGGTVPGPIGMPVPVMALGGEQFLGANSAGAAPGTSIVINNPMLLDEISMRGFMRQLKQLMSEDGRRTSFAHVNTGYFPGSSGL